MKTTQSRAIGTVAALALLVLTGSGLRADEAENRAMRAVLKFGGEVTRDEKADGKPVIVVRLGGTPVTDAGLKKLAPLITLQTLDLGSTQVTDAGLKELASFKRLQALALRGTQVTDGGLKEVAGLKTLRILYLENTRVTDAGLKELAALKTLKILNLVDTQVTEAGKTELRKALPKCQVFP